MSENEFLNLSTNMQIASALLLIAIFLAIIAFKKDIPKKSSKHHHK